MSKEERNPEIIDRDIYVAEDRELRFLLNHWEVPDAPPSLDKRIMDAYQSRVDGSSRWNWIFNPSIPALALTGLLATVVVASAIVLTLELSLPKRSIEQSKTVETQQ